MSSIAIETIGELICLSRTRLRWTQARLAAQANQYRQPPMLTQRRLSRIEAGDRPYFDEIVAIAWAMGLSVKDFEGLS